MHFNFGGLFVHIPALLPGQKLSSCAPPYLFVRGNISDLNFLHIEEALKPRLRRKPFLLGHSRAEVNYLPLKTSIVKYELYSARKTLHFRFKCSTPDKEGSNSPHPGHGWQSNTSAFPDGGCRNLEMISALRQGKRKKGVKRKVACIEEKRASWSGNHTRPRSNSHNSW